MKIKRLAILAGLAVAVTASASPLTPAEALARLEREAPRRGAAAAPAQYSGCIESALGTPAIYIYNYPGGNGFMLLAADDAAAPLIGYSETGSFSLTDAPLSLASWWGGYADAIAEAGAAGEKYVAAGTRASSGDAIEPMLTTKWDQTNPYNNECPDINGRRCLTGCVATAMAQVMNYWQYPATGSGSVTYTPESLGKELSIDFSEITFDWANMLDEYKKNYSSAAVHAVASLMRACGYSVKMRYNTGESGALTQDIPTALVNYFGYDQGISRKSASNFASRQEWDDLIYRELLNVGPVILTGQASTGGHCFVCDGYDGNGYFHINWGWSGLSDGYFLLDALNPSDIGAGGHYGGYNTSQSVITGIMPPVGRLTLESIAIGNAADDTGNVKDWGYTYRINDFSNIQLNLTLKVSGGHVSTPLHAMVYELDPVTKLNKELVLEKDFSEPFSASDGVFTVSTLIRMTDFDPSKFYSLVATYDLKGQRTMIGSVRFAASSGVDDALAPDNGIEIVREGLTLRAECGGRATLTLYDLAGGIVARSEGTSPALHLGGTGSGVYIAEAVSAAGERRVVKLHLR